MGIAASVMVVSVVVFRNASLLLVRILWDICSELLDRNGTSEVERQL